MARAMLACFPILLLSVAIVLTKRPTVGYKPLSTDYSFKVLLNIIGGKGALSNINYYYYYYYYYY